MMMVGDDFIIEKRENAKKEGRYRRSERREGEYARSVCRRLFMGGPLFYSVLEIREDGVTFLSFWAK